jgi:hypothetical protein
LSAKAIAAHQHYSTGLALLAGEDQIAGLLDAAFMQFYLAVESILQTHESSKAPTSGISLFGERFDENINKIVRHVYVARHRFFGHAHPRYQKGRSDPEMAFAVAKQTLVARWCARSLIALELNRPLVRREMRLYPSQNTSIEFDGNASSLDVAFALPS